jgi:CubicO group peptidase (beta-lactamase class C family)
MHRILVAALAALTLIAAPQEKLATDASRSTPGGATFKVPAGWSVRNGPTLVVIEAPEPDTHVAVVDTKEKEAAAAVAAAWQAYRPGFKRPLKLVTDRPGRDGWEERKVFNYETSPNERVVVQAIAQRIGAAWTVLLLDGTEPTVEKRGAPLGSIFQSLRPAGHSRESFAGRKALPLTPERVAAMKQFVQDGMQKLGVPGVSIALYDGGKVVFEGGFGVRELGKSTPVDANTLFMAASNTKGMSTLLLARLADQKKLRWDQPVTELYPPFKLGSSEVTKQVLMKHLVCACTGLPRQDLEWIFEFKNATPASSLALLGTMQPTSKFGEVFQYSNLMAAAAGYVGGQLYAPDKELGAAYDAAMDQLIFKPLGMTSTTFDVSKALAGNHATPHGDDVDGKPSVARNDFNYSIAPHRPAGGVWTSAHDLMRYVQLELGRGTIDGRRLVSEENILERRKPQIATGENQSYGMGLSIDRRDGVAVIHHGGSMAGFKSDIIFLPDHGVGAVILTNSGTGQMLLGPFRRRLLEILFDGRPEAVADVEASAKNYRAALAKERQRLVVPAAAAEVAQLAAAYHSDALGDLTVRKQDGATAFDFGEWSSTVASRKNDDGTISFITIDPAIDGFEFVRAERNGKRALLIRDGQHEYVFEARN